MFWSHGNKYLSNSNFLGFYSKNSDENSCNTFVLSKAKKLICNKNIWCPLNVVFSSVPLTLQKCEICIIYLLYFSLWIDRILKCFHVTFTFIFFEILCPPYGGSELPQF